MEDYPPPCPPVGKKSEIFNVSDFADIDRRARKAPNELLHSSDNLVAYLTKDLTTDLSKLRSLFTWMGSQDLIDYRKYLKDGPSGTPYHFLQQITQLGEGKDMCKLFQTLCRVAGLPCEVVPGYTKYHKAYFVGDKIKDVNCHWVMVYVDGSWRLVDIEVAFLGSVSKPSDIVLIEESGEAVRQREGVATGTIQSIDEDCFLPDPEDFIYSYFPEDPKWQLLSQPWSKKKFHQTSDVTLRYLQSSWHLSEVHNAVIRTHDGRCRIGFDQVPAMQYAIRYKLFYNEKKSEKMFPNELQMTSYIRTVGGKDQQVVFTRLPLAGIYLLEILDGDKKTLCKVCIQNTGKEVKNVPFPSIPDTGLGINQKAIDKGLVDISREDGLVVAREGEKVRFQFRTKKALAVVTRLVHAVVPSEELENRVKQVQDEDLMTIEVIVPWHAQNPEYCLQVDVKPEDEDDSSLENVLNYLLTPDKLMVHTIRGKEEQVKGELESAIADHDAYRLESALKEYRIERMESNHRYEKACYRLCKLYRMEVEKALQDKDKLEAVLSDVEQSQVAFLMQGVQWLVQAQQTLRTMKRLAAMKDKVQTLTGKQISEIQTYNHPSKNIRAVVVATYLLLGERQKKLKKWKKVQALLRSHGKYGIIYRIKNHDVSQVNKKDAEKASALLDTCTQEEICCQSVSAAALYNWSKAVVDMMAESKNDNVTDSQQQDQSNDDVTDSQQQDRTNDDVTDSQQQDQSNDDVTDSQQQDQSNDDVTDSQQQDRTNDDVTDSQQQHQTNDDVTDSQQQDRTNDDVTDSQQQDQSNDDVTDSEQHDQSNDDVTDGQQQDRTNDDVTDNQRQDQNNDDVTGDQAAADQQKDDKVDDKTTEEWKKE